MEAAEELFVGSILGLLVLKGPTTAMSTRSERRTAVTMGEAAKAAAATDNPCGWDPRRLPPVFSLPVVRAQRHVHGNPRDIASAGIDAAAPEGCVADDADTDASKTQAQQHPWTRFKKNARTAADADMRLRRAQAVERYARLPAGTPTFVPATSEGALAVSGCLLDGIASSEGTDGSAAAIPTGAVIRLLGPDAARSQNGDEVAKDPGGRVLVFGRPAWMAYLRDLRMPRIEAAGEGFAIDHVKLMTDPVHPALLTKDGPSAGWWPSDRDILSALSRKSTSVREALVRTRRACASFSDMAEVVQSNIASIENEPAEVGHFEDASVPSLEAGAERLDDIAAFVSAMVAAEPEPSLRSAAFVSESGAELLDLERELGDADAASCLAPLFALPAPDGRNGDPEYVKAMAKTSRALSLTGLFRGGPPGPEEASAAQGHLRMADVVLRRDPDSLGLRMDHVRTVDPEDACATRTAMRARRDAIKALAPRERKAQGSEGPWRELARQWSDSVSGLRSSSLAFRPGRSVLALPKGSMAAEATLPLIDEGDESLIMEVIGIGDRPHYYKRIEAPAARSPQPGPLSDVDAMLSEMAAVLGVTPSLGMSEHRSLLDMLLAEGELEQTRNLRRRLAEVVARRAELMVKANATGAQYESIERRLIERIRKDAEPKIVVETAAHLAHLLRRLVTAQPHRISTDTSSTALVECIRSEAAPARPSRSGGAAQKRKREAEGSLDGLLQCTVMAVLSGRLAPPGPDRQEVTEALRAAAERVGDDEGPFPIQVFSTRTDAATHSDASPPWEHFRPLPVQDGAATPSRRSRKRQPQQQQQQQQQEIRRHHPRQLLSALWTYVRAQQPKLTVPSNRRGAGTTATTLLLHPASAACCSFEVGRSIWDMLLEWDEDGAGQLSAALALDRELALAGGETEAAVTRGIPRAALPQPSSRRQAPVASPIGQVDRELLAREDWASTAPDPEGEPGAEVNAAIQKVILNRFSSLWLDEAISALLSSAAGRGYADLFPATDKTLNGLAKATKDRFHDLEVRNVLGKPAAASLRASLLSERTPAHTIDVVRTATGFLRSELGPALSKLSVAEIGASFENDMDLARVAGEMRERLALHPEDSERVHARVVAVAGACPLLAGVSEQALRRNVDPADACGFAVGSTVYVLWSLAQMADAIPEDVGQSVIRAASLLVVRLIERLSHERRDRYEEEELAMRAKMDAQWLRQRETEERLDQEQREMLRDLRNIRPEARVADLLGEGRRGPAEAVIQRVVEREEDASSLFS